MNLNLAHHKKTALTKLISTNVPIFQDDQKIITVCLEIENTLHKFDQADYVFVTNQDHHLVGIISLYNLFTASDEKKTLASLISKRPLVFVHDELTPAQAAYVAIKNELNALPVVDSGEHFLGVVNNHKLSRIIYQEAKHSLLHFAGIASFSHPGNILEVPLFISFKNRMPWLIIGLIGGTLSAGLIGFFEKVIAQHLILAAFIPLIVYMSDAVGTQMEAFIIRDSALDDKINYKKYFLRHFLVVSIIALISSLMLMAIGALMSKSLIIGLVLALSLFCAIISSVFTGLLIPIVFIRYHLDPANASGPIATIIQDVLSIFVYFSIATLLIPS